jgi:hypothetical protein
MTNLSKLNIFGKIYVVVALIVAAIFSPLTFSFVPVILLAWYLYEWRWPLSPMVGLLTQYFIFFALTILFSSIILYWLAPLISLPVLIPIIRALEKTALSTQFQDNRRQRILTRTAIVSLILVLAIIVLALLVTSLALTISGSVLLI